jgi:RNA polymerase sigma-B factor
MDDAPVLGPDRSGDPPGLLARRGARDRTRRDIDDRLFRLYARTRSPQTRDAIVRRYLPLARHVVRRYAGGPEPLDDLVQVASLGLVGAIERYDPGRGPSFSSFAVATIDGEIKRHFRDRSYLVRPPRSLQELGKRADAAEARLRCALARTPTVAELAEELGVDPQRVREALRVRTAAHFDSMPQGDGDEEGAFAPWARVEEEGYARAEARATLAPLLRTLRAHEREIVRLRFVEDRTQREIGEAMGVSQMQVSRVLASAIERLSMLADAA